MQRWSARLYGGAPPRSPQRTRLLALLTGVLFACLIRSRLFLKFNLGKMAECMEFQDYLQAGVHDSVREGTPAASWAKAKMRLTGIPRQKEQLSDYKMACPTALPAVHVAPASSQWRMLHSHSCGGHLQACHARLTVQTPGIASPRTRGGTAPLRPPALGAKVSTVPAHPNATHLHVAASPVGGQHARPCPRAPCKAAGPGTQAPPGGSVWCLAWMLAA